MTKTSKIPIEDLHGYIDGELDEAVRTSVERALASDPGLADQAALYRADKAMIGEAFGAGLDEPLPQEWVARINRASRQTRWNHVAVSAMALAATVVLVFGLTVAIQRSAAPARDDIVADALAARANEIGPQSVVAIRTDADAQIQAGAMTKALQTSVKAPDLSRMGYRLVGIEAYDTPMQSFQLIYRDRLARVFTIYVRRSSGAVRFDQFAQNGLRICVWQDNEVGAVMAGTMSEKEMLRLESPAYYGLTGTAAHA